MLLSSVASTLECCWRQNVGNAVSTLLAYAAPQRAENVRDQGTISDTRFQRRMIIIVLPAYGCCEAKINIVKSLCRVWHMVNPR